MSMKTGSRARLSVSSVAAHRMARHALDSPRVHLVFQCPIRSSRPLSFRVPTKSYRMSICTVIDDPELSLISTTSNSATSTRDIGAR